MHDSTNIDTFSRVYSISARHQRCPACLSTHLVQYDRPTENVVVTECLDCGISRATAPIATTSGTVVQILLAITMLIAGTGIAVSFVLYLLGDN